MKQSEFEKEFAKACSQMNRVKMVSDTLNALIASKSNEHAAASSVMLNDEVEKLIRITRQLPMFTGMPKYTMNKDKIIVDAMNIKLGFTVDEWFAVYLPALLPHKKKGSTEYIRDSLVAALNEFFLDNKFLRINKCVIATCYIYNELHSERKWRDYDNVENKAALDVLASFVLRDDSPVFCSQYYCSYYGCEDGTVIYFLPPDEMDKFLTYLDLDDLPTIYTG